MLKKVNGFTIIEMLVVMVIISVLTVLVLTNYRSGQKKYALEQAAQKLVSDIRRAQNMAISGVGISASSGRRGYGVYIKEDATSYIIYADKSGSSSYQSPAVDETIETVNLSNKVKIESVSATNQKMDIFFKPPEPITYLNIPGSPTLGTITLGVVDSSLTKIITVTTAGLIYGN